MDLCIIMISSFVGDRYVSLLLLVFISIYISFICVVVVCGMWYFYFVYPIVYYPSTIFFGGWRYWRLEETICAYPFVFLYSLYA